MFVFGAARMQLLSCQARTVLWPSFACRIRAAGRQGLEAGASRPFAGVFSVRHVRSCCHARHELLFWPPSACRIRAAGALGFEAGASGPLTVAWLAWCLGTDACLCFSAAALRLVCSGLCACCLAGGCSSGRCVLAGLHAGLLCAGLSCALACMLPVVPGVHAGFLQLFGWLWCFCLPGLLLVAGLPLAWWLCTSAPHPLGAGCHAA